MLSNCNSDIELQYLVFLYHHQLYCNSILVSMGKVWENILSNLSVCSSSIYCKYLQIQTFDNWHTILSIIHRSFCVGKLENEQFVQAFYMVYKSCTEKYFQYIIITQQIRTKDLCHIIHTPKSVRQNISCKIDSCVSRGCCQQRYFNESKVVAWPCRGREIRVWRPALETELDAAYHIKSRH